MNEPKDPKDLDQAASEWAPDQTQDGAANPASDTPKKKPRARKADVQASDGPGAAVGNNPEGGNDYVALIDTPFHIPTLEINEAQQSNEELDLDKDLDRDNSEGLEVAPETEDEAAPSQTEADADLPPEENYVIDDTPLTNLAQKIADQTAELEAQALAAQGQTPEQLEKEAAEELARQIAEDEALQAQVAKEQAEAEAAALVDPELLAALPKEPTTDEHGNLDLSEMQSCIETLLFMVDKPVSAKRLQEWLGPQFSEELFTQALQALQTRYQSPSHGIELVEIASGWQLRTKPGRAALAKKLAKVQTQRLSSGGMETLAIISYRQPVMKEEIDKIRGVDSSYFVRGLLEKKLIEISGRSELPGRPMLYSTTQHFLELFGLKDLASLPPLRELEQMVPASQSKNPEDDDPRVREMRRLVGQMKADTSTSLLYDPHEDEKILTEIRERVKSIPTSTPYLDEQKAAEKAAAEAAKQAAKPQNQPEGTQFDLDTMEQAMAASDVLPTSPEMLDIPPPESLDEPEPTTDQV